MHCGAYMMNNNYRLILQYLKNPKYYIKFIVISLCIVSIHGLYILYEDIVFDPIPREIKLRQKRDTDSGPKCDITITKWNKSQEFKNYQTTFTFQAHDVHKVNSYDPSKHVLGFLHIQKTGGSVFSSYINAKAKKDTKNDNNSLFGEKPKHNPRINSGNVLFYMLCGLHSDWNSVIGCTKQLFTKKTLKEPQPTAMLLTMLRDPTDRYISEWLHISRGSTWLPAVTQCQETDIPHMEPPPKCIPKTYPLDHDVFPVPIQWRQTKLTGMFGAYLQRWAAGSRHYARWEAVTLNDFMACPDNPASNRMVNMLADQRVLGDTCNSTKLSKQDKDNRLLKSAQQNLLKMAMFGLMEHQVKTEQLFNVMLGVKFKSKLRQRTVNHIACQNITESQRTAIKKLNYLDHKLYLYAKDLFFERLKAHNLL